MERIKKKVTSCCGGLNMGDIESVYLVDTSRIEVEDFKIDFSSEAIEKNIRLIPSPFGKSWIYEQFFNEDKPKNECKPLPIWYDLPACEAVEGKKFYDQTIKFDW